MRSTAPPPWSFHLKSLVKTRSALWCVSATVLLWLTVLGCRPPAVMPPADDKASVDDLVTRTVKVYASCTNKRGTGSGVVLEGGPSHLVVATADHVVDGEDCTVGIQAADGKLFHVFKVEHDAEHDVAILRTLLGWTTPSLLARQAELGESVVTTGYPSDLLVSRTKLTVTRGHVAAMYESRGGKFRFTAPIRPGSSGGPVWSRSGDLLGLVVSGYDRYGIPMDGNYYAAASDWVVKLAY